MDIKKKLGTRIQELRKQKWFSQVVLSERIWIHRTYLSAVERGVKNVAVENIERIAGALGVEIKYLFE